MPFRHISSFPGGQFVGVIHCPGKTFDPPDHHQQTTRDVAGRYADLFPPEVHTAFCPSANNLCDSPELRRCKDRMSAIRCRYLDGKTVVPRPFAGTDQKHSCEQASYPKPLQPDGLIKSRPDACQKRKPCIP